MNLTRASGILLHPTSLPNGVLDRGAYRFVDLAAGEYGLSVTAHECEPAAFVLELADEAVLRQDVDLVPAGLPSDDVVTAHR